MTSKKLRMINVIGCILVLWLVVVENADAEMTREEAMILDERSYKFKL